MKSSSTPSSSSLSATVRVPLTLPSNSHGYSLSAGTRVVSSVKSSSVSASSSFTSAGVFI